MKALIKRLPLFGGLLPFAALAQAPTPNPVGQVTNITTTTDVLRIIQNFITFATAILFALVVIFVLYAGYLYLTGNEDNIKKAKAQVIYIVIGVALILVAQTVTVFVQNFLSTTVS